MHDKSNTHHFNELYFYDLVKRLKGYRNDAVVFQAVKGQFKSWRWKQVTLLYMNFGRVCLVAGAPVGPQDQLHHAANAFVEHARSRGRRVRFVATEDIKWTFNQLSTTEVGYMPVWQPLSWPESLKRHRGLREQLRRARAKGITVEQIQGSDVNDEFWSSLYPKLVHIQEQWYASRKLPPLDFLLRDNCFSCMTEQRYFIARRGSEVVSFLNVIPVYPTGWFIENMYRARYSPNGTTELLVNQVIHEALESEITDVTMGLVPLHDTKSSALSLIRKLGKPFYNFDGLFTFRNRLRPSSWKPVYLVFPKGDSQAVAFLDVARALLPRKFTRGRRVTTDVLNHHFAS